MQFVAVASNPWDGQWMNRQHLMWAVKDHAPVVYVQEPEPWHRSWKPRDERFVRPNRERKAHGLTVLRLPKVLCARGRSGMWNQAAFRLKARMIDSIAGDRDHRVLYFWHPELFPYIELLQPARVIYHMYDRFAEYHEPKYSGTAIYNAFHNACKLADVVVCGTKEQAAIVPGRDAVVVPNGVAFDWYAGELPPPDEMANIPYPRIGYAGTISNKLELRWFEAIAEQSDWHLVLVGPVGNFDAQGAADFARLCSRKNVHYLGSKPARALPAYLKSFDVALANYRRGTHIEAASPLKLFEYAAAGLPMVASRVGGLDDHAEIVKLVTLVDTADEAVQAVAQYLATGSDPASIERRLDFARNNSWQHRAKQVMQLATSSVETSTDLPSSSTNVRTELVGRLE